MEKIRVSEELNLKYNNYYDGDSKQFLKRELTALEVFQHIRQVYSTQHVGKLIDVGAGEGSLLQCLGKSRFADELYGVEISESGINAIRKKQIPNLVEIRQFDGYRIPYPDKFFDLAISSHVLEHVEHERIFLMELKRIAKNIIIEVPLEHTIRVNRSMQISQAYGHINFYTLETLLNLLKTSSLNCKHHIVITYSTSFEIFIAGKVKGYINSFIRKSALKLFPGLATKFLVYFCIAYCCSDD